MEAAGEIRKEISFPETEDVVKTLENLDKRSIVLAGTYITALADRQKLEKAKQKGADICG